MAYFGIRCSNTDYTYAVLDGNAHAPTVTILQRVAFPTGYEEAEKLRWFCQEMRGLFGAHQIDGVAVKRAETNVKRSNSLELRIEHEGIVLLVAAQEGCAGISRKVNSTIAKDLGLKGKAKYLQSKLDTSPLPNFSSCTQKQKDALLAAWSCMN